MRNRQQGNAVFVVGHDARHALGGGAAFGLIELRLASRDGFCILRLQQLRAGRAGVAILRGGSHRGHTEERPG